MKRSSAKTLTAPIRRVRFVYVAMFFCVWVAAVGSRLCWLQIVRHSYYMERAKQQQQRGFEVSPARGVLYDRNLNELAMTVQADSIFAVPSEVAENRAEDAAMLAKVVHIDPLDHYTAAAAILARLNAQRNFAWVARKVDAETARRVKELNLHGIYWTSEPKRFYPNADLAAHVLGYVGTEDNGLGGLEQQFDQELHGVPGHRLTDVDAKRHVMGSDEQQPQPGENLVTSIDSNIQYMAERALDAQVAKMKAAHGTAVVQDPHTGQILALAVSPRFNPNDSHHIDGNSLKNLAVSDVYEPGSTFKLVSYSAALDSAGVEPTDIVDCQGGAMTMYGRTLHDDKSDHFGRVTVQFALEHSSDVGAAKMALKVGNDKFYDYIRGFGFGQRSGVELPSETRGILRPPKKWGATSVLSLAIGHEIGVTPVQLVTMVSAIANGGVYMPPHVLLQSTDQLKGDPRLKPIPFRPVSQLPAQLPDGAHRVIRELTAAKMRAMMAGTVTEGTGRSAALNGYSAGGKTGTAQKIDPVTHTYSHTRTVASFAGFAPVSDPAIAVAVVIDDPTVGTRYGAETSAPVFAAVAQEALEYLGVPHDQPLKTKAQMLQARAETEPDDTPDQGTDLNAMFEQANSLPQDDPLRQPATAAALAQNQIEDAADERRRMAQASRPGKLQAMLPQKMLAAFRANGGTSSVMPNDTPSTPASLPLRHIQPAVQTKIGGAVVIDGGKRVSVPQFNGATLRAVVENAGSVGLRIQPLGSGLAREQVPTAGTMVPLGTEVVVRFAR